MSLLVRCGGAWSVIEDEDTIIGIYDWKSNDERLAWSQSLDPGTREQLLELLATPMRVVLADHIE